MQVDPGSSLSTTLKILLIGAIVLVLQIPLLMLGKLTEERVALREQAYAKVASGWGGKLFVGGPMLVIPTRSIRRRRTASPRPIASPCSCSPNGSMPR